MVHGDYKHYISYRKQLIYSMYVCPVCVLFSKLLFNFLLYTVSTAFLLQGYYILFIFILYLHIYTFTHPFLMHLHSACFKYILYLSTHLSRETWKRPSPISTVKPLWLQNRNTSINMVQQLQQKNLTESPNPAMILNTQADFIMSPIRSV